MRVGMVVALVLALGGVSALERNVHGRLEHEHATLRVLDTLAATDADLATSILELRAGTLAYFDPIVRDVKLLRQVSALPSPAGEADSGQWQRQALARLAADLRTQEDWVETLKTDHSLLRNSSLHFPMAAATLERNSAASPARLDALRTALARYSIGPSKSLSEQAAHEVDALEASPAPADAVGAEARRSLIGHARSIVERRERVDDLVRKILRSPTRAGIAELVQFHRRVESRALVVLIAARTVLLVLGLLTAIALGELLMRWRPRASVPPVRASARPADG